jgi:ACS family tartrate transporter-like MFS transporter
MILYLTYWIPAADRARTGALFMMAAPVAVIVGAPLSEALLTLDGALGLKGWQWLFLVEGLPSVALGMLSLRVLTDRPESASWLREDDRRWLAGVMAAERSTRESVGLTSIRRSFSSGRVWLLCTVFFLNSIVNYGMFLWLPRLLRDVTGAEGFTLSLITAVPFIAALITMVVVGRHSDRTGERRRHVAGCAAITAIGLLLAVAAQRYPWILVLAFTIAQMGLRSLAAVFWAMPPQLLGGRSAAAGIALINSIGNLGGFVGPTIIGVLLDATGGYTGGLLALTGALIVEAALVLAVRLPPSALRATGGKPANQRVTEHQTDPPGDQPSVANERQRVSLASGAGHGAPASQPGGESEGRKPLG